MASPDASQSLGMAIRSFSSGKRRGVKKDKEFPPLFVREGVGGEFQEIVSNLKKNLFSKH